MLENTDYSHVWVLLASLIVAVPAVLAIIATIRSRSLRTGRKAVWTVLLLVPVIGVVAWLVAKPTGFDLTRRRTTTDR